MNLHKQRGLGLISAIGLIVLVAVIATALARLLQHNIATDETGLLRIRALAAAESGLELALNRAYAPAGVPACANHTWAFDLNGMRGCTAVTSCTASTVAGQNYYDLNSRATCTAASATSSRAMQARALAL